MPAYYLPEQESPISRIWNQSIDLIDEDPFISSMEKRGMGNIDELEVSDNDEDVSELEEEDLDNNYDLQ